MSDKRRYCILAVSSDAENKKCIQTALDQSQWDVQFVGNVNQALERLEQSEAALIICDRQTTGDSGWRFLLRELAGMPHRPLLVVGSRLADDDLWQDVLGSGGYDVLPFPFEKRDLFRILSLAGNYWRARRATPVRARVAAIA